AGITAGTVTYGGFSTNTILRSYFQFSSNQFSIRMQLKNSQETTHTRLYAMSFTQCDIFDYKAPTLTILQGKDTDGDLVDNQLDLDSDNDGIPDNVEFQSTLGYVAPTMTLDGAGLPVKDEDGNVEGVDPVTGIDDSYAIPIPNEDTDGDNIPDFLDLDSDGDGKPDITENGMASEIVLFTDSDGDGLDKVFEGTNVLDPHDVNDDINVPSASILPDEDMDVLSGGDLDYRDAIDVFFESASIDFDGVDDYLTTDSFMGGLAEATLMAWIKLDSDFSPTKTGDVAGQGMMRMYIDGSTKQLYSYIVTNGGSAEYVSSSSTVLDSGNWYHVVISYDGSTGSAKIYINGEEDASSSIGLGSALSSDPTITEPDFNIGRNSKEDNSFFMGSIDEVRVFNMALTKDQIQRMVYQEIEEKSGNVTGSLIDKSVVDIGSSTPIPWPSLLAYYPMSNIFTGKTTDQSIYGRDASLKNIFTIQEQTAPMPYETGQDGPWNAVDTWKNGMVWDITDIPNLKEWAIIDIKNDVSLSESLTTLGLKIDSGGNLSVSGDHAITNKWYLELNGTLDLSGDSQLLQGPNSDLVASASGQVLRRQEGTSNVYWYNYWSSPVGATAITSLSDNNGVSNNPNNTSFSIDMLKDGNGDDVQFTSAYDAPAMVSDKWLYSYQNGISFWDWVALTPSSEIEPGMGYTQKGSSINPDGNFQQYIFQGKPNNGTVTVEALYDPVAVANSEPGEIFSSLIGNPYPSAIDARKFIQDNDGVIEGTVLLWEQWAGDSHLLAEYEGGYGFIADDVTERAYQYPGINLADPDGLTPGIKVPTFYIPVGQGFFVEIIASGDITFKNSQREFIKESDADGEDPENGSTFFRDVDPLSDSENLSDYQFLRLEFSVSSGASRSFVLGFSEDATDGWDYGKDGGRITDPPADDMGSILNGEQYVIQSFSPITQNKEIDLVMHTSGDFTYSVKATEINNIPENQAVFLRDNLTGQYFDLRSGSSYDFTSLSGTDLERFQVVFNESTLSNEDLILDNIIIFLEKYTDRLFIKNLQEDARELTLTNTLGQVVRSYNALSSNSMQNGIHLGKLSSGVYFVNLITESGAKLDKKILKK
ncbi:MAG: T9SS type A sorting domain-containing protein, partial [Flavobacteriaceae bacterium]|nr:T9SS type A sorting domain-containing protein [Bacteroidia bacterium]NNL60767.1 T9SS type A sorting domain-containing protein [Flavobacteriaceae bacterium]